MIANETYVNANDIFHFTTDGDFLGRLLSRDQLAAQLIGASWNTSGGTPVVEPVMMAFSKEGQNRYLYIVLDYNSSFPMIKLDLSNNTVVEDNLHVFSTKPYWMQKGKDGLIYITTFVYNQYYTLDTTSASLSVTSVTTSLNEYIQSIVSTSDGQYLVRAIYSSRAFVCDERSLTTCTPLDTNNQYSNPSASENGEFTAFGGEKDWDNYLFINASDNIKIEDTYSISSSSIDFMNNGDLIVALRESIYIYTYNHSERSYTYAGLINSNRGETYESEYVQMIVNPDNGHFFVTDPQASRLDEFDEQGIYIRSNAFSNYVGKVDGTDPITRQIKTPLS